MKPSWKTYQQQAAEFFTTIGLSAAVEEPVQGIRVKHKVDVFVTGKVHGLDLRWVVECKQWSSNVPKEKVLALLAIVQDIGADKGILLSEVGFQSGAIKAARSTNLLLTSIADLKEDLKESMLETIISSLHWRLTKVSTRLSALHKIQKEHDYMFTPALSENAKLMCLDFAFKDALAGNFPTVYAIGPNETRVAATDFDEMVKGAGELIRHAEEYAEANAPSVDDGRSTNQRK